MASWWYNALCGDHDESDESYFLGQPIAIERLKNDMISYNVNNRKRYIESYTSKAFMSKLVKMVQPRQRRMKVMIDHTTRKNAIMFETLEISRQQFDIYCRCDMNYNLHE